VPDLIRFVPGVVPDEFASQFAVADVDLVVEIVSPESRYRDHEVKPVEYRAAGIPEMWIVTPHKIPGETTSDASSRCIGLMRRAIPSRTFSGRSNTDHPATSRCAGNNAAHPRRRSGG
jgi:Uma2 family endonuclease